MSEHLCQVDSWVKSVLLSWLEGRFSYYISISHANGGFQSLCQKLIRKMRFWTFKFLCDPWSSSPQPGKVLRFFLLYFFHKAAACMVVALNIKPKDTHMQPSSVQLPNGPLPWWLSKETLGLEWKGAPGIFWLWHLFTCWCLHYTWIFFFGPW